MRINKILAGALVGALLTLEAWTLREVVGLKVAVAQIQTTLQVQHIAKANE